MKSWNQYITEGMELTKLKEKVERSLGEKEIYKDSEIFQADTIEREETKEKKLRKNISEEPENYLRKNR